MPTSLHSHPLKGVLYGFLAYACFSMSDILVKLMANTLSVSQILGLQTLFGLVIISTLMPFHGGLQALRIKSKTVFIARGFTAGFGALLAYYGFTKLPIADVYALIFCTPILVTILSVFLLKEKVQIYRWSAVIIGFIGILIIIRPNFASLTLGHAACLIAAFTGAAGTLIVRKFGSQEQPLALLFAIMLGYLTIGIPGFLDFPSVSLKLWLMLAASGSLVTLGQILVIRALNAAPASSVAPTQYTQMIWAVVLGSLFLNEFPSIYTFIGMTLIIGASLFTLYRERIHGRTLYAQIKR